MDKTKTQSQREHCKKRFLERFGIDFNKTVRHYFLNEIHSGHSTCVGFLSNRVRIHDVYYNGKIYRVVYDKLRDNIVTVLPRDENGGLVTPNKQFIERDVFMELKYN